MLWFRSHHGAPTDTKWLLVAKLAHTLPGIVSAIWWALMDHASQAAERGSIVSFDPEAYAAFSGFDPAVVAAVLDALRERRLIDADGARLSAWSKRNPDDYSTDRVRKHRANKEQMKRDETLGNADEMRVDEMRVDERLGQRQKEKAPSEPKRKGAHMVPENWQPKAAHFRLAHELEADITDELARFRDYTFRRKLCDWDAAFREWLTGANSRRFS